MSSGRRAGPESRPLFIPDFAFEPVVTPATKAVSGRKGTIFSTGRAIPSSLGPRDKPAGPRNALRGPAPWAKPDGASPLPWISHRPRLGSTRTLLRSHGGQTQTPSCQASTATANGSCKIRVYCYSVRNGLGQRRCALSPKRSASVHGRSRGRVPLMTADRASECLPVLICPSQLISSPHPPLRPLPHSVVFPHRGGAARG